MLGELDELLELDDEGIPAELLELLLADWQAASARLTTPSTTNLTICICCNLIGVRITKWGWIAEQSTTRKPASARLTTFSFDSAHLAASTALIVNFHRGQLRFRAATLSATIP